MAIRWGPSQQREPDRRQRQPARERAFVPETHHELGRQAHRERRHDQVGGQKGEPHLQGRVSQYALQIQGGDEEPGEAGHCPQHTHDVRRAEIARPEQSQWDERCGHARLNDEEDRQHECGCRE